MKNLFRCTALFIASLVILQACKTKKKVSEPEATTPFIIKKDTAMPQGKETTVRPPIVNIVDTFALKYIVLYVKDSAASSDRISQKLEKIYGTILPGFIEKQKLKTAGPPMAWFKSNKAPFYFEAGIPVNKKPAKMQKGILVKNIGGQRAYLAHFFGPYSLTYMGYDALADFVENNKKKRNGFPYEMYVTPPVDKDGKAIDPYKVQTDIVYPYK